VAAPRYPVGDATMPIAWVEGDLFDNAHGAHAFGHGCNCQGSMGAGIAVGFRERYPAMYEEYRRRCKVKPRAFNPGDVFLWKEDDLPWVFNLATQEGTWRSRATYPVVEQTLATMRALADAEGITSIAIPRIGTGYGGLAWSKIKPIIARIFDDWPGTLFVYEAYVAQATEGNQSGR
jgi:O-acetyl-ADP-ribose deacetylase (regulator of RNase III)